MGVRQQTGVDKNFTPRVKVSAELHTAVQSLEDITILYGRVVSQRYFVKSVRTESIQHDTDAWGDVHFSKCSKD